ncbi:broad-complex core protein isoform X1 [Drosophila biarmipes]|uniref:broad-complex core protein isoform X1 n=1 Tax=Drosophila biarmipes TaxID=125945 RepID=UPI0007E67F31|nr:broad-complex core protein isoform X1 [Drosophila biarmipes]
MDDEFKLCWKNFQDNIASGFQNLYDRGDLVDVTLACDGKLLHAHKIVLAICSPYFQEIFTTNPCKHPIIILKDVSFNIMMELLEFMYQGVVNVKHTELQSFMKIGQLLQIKGLATNSNSSPGSSVSEKSSSQPQAEESNNSNHHNSNSNSNNNSKTEADHNESKGQSNSRTTSPGSASRASNEASHLYASSKRPMPSDFGSDSLSIYSGKQLRRSLKDHGSGGSDGGGGENADSAAGLDNSLNSEEFFLPPIPHITMGEQRYDLGALKRESDSHHHGPSSSGGGGSSNSVGSLTSSASPSAPIRNPFGPAFSMDNYNFFKSSNNSGPSGSSNNSVGPGGINNNGSVGLGSGTEYPNELYMPNDYSKNFANHMDIPSGGSNMVMLSTTSLLHGNCVFNRNNTVATQQGMKTYWLCKSYRISMCRARCITHLGRIISATGVHNHTPHMRGGQGSSAASTASVSGTPSASGPIPSQAGYSLTDGGGHLGSDLQHGNRVSNMFANQTPPPPPPPPPLPVASAPHHPHHHHHLGQPLPNLLVQHHPAPPHMEQHGGSSNLMHNPNLMHLQTQTHHHQQHHQQHSPHNPPPPQQHNLEMGGGSGAGAVLLSPAHLQQSPQSNRSSHSLQAPSPPPQPVEEQQALQQQQQQEGATAEAATDPSAAHVINSITISPNSRHTFKMENM